DLFCPRDLGVDLPAALDLRRRKIIILQQVVGQRLVARVNVILHAERLPLAWQVIEVATVARLAEYLLDQITPHAPPTSHQALLLSVLLLAIAPLLVSHGRASSPVYQRLRHIQEYRGSAWRQTSGKRPTGAIGPGIDSAMQRSIQEVKDNLVELGGL